MSAGLQYDEETSKRLEASYSTPDVVAQREAVLQLLELRPGENVLDVGSGPGFLAADMARAVGDSGRVRGIDISEAMIAISQRRCANMAHVEAWSDHCVDFHFPRRLTSKLAQAGFQISRRHCIPLFNPDYDPNTYSHHLIGLIAAFVPGKAWCLKGGSGSVG
jgi:SAM-dependent methyltransferase